MLFQTFGIDTLATPLRGSRMTAHCALDPADRRPSRRTPWSDLRFGFVGSAETYDLLRFEVTTLALTRATAPPVMAAGAIDALVVECTEDEVVGDWGTSFLDWSAADDRARDLFDEARRLDLPRIALSRGGAGHVELFAPLAAEADHVCVSDPALQAGLKSRGIDAVLLPQAVQPALYNGLAEVSTAIGTAPPVLSLDLAEAINDPDIADFVHRLTPFGLALCSADLVVSQRSVETLPDAAVGASHGSVTPAQLSTLMGRADILVQIARTDRDPAREVQNALHAAASQCAVVILGELAEDDPRKAFARVFTDPHKLRFFISRLLLEPLRTRMHMRVGWRAVHSGLSAETFALTIIHCVDPDADGPPLKSVTVVAPTSRPERLDHLLTSFRAQSWPDKELVIVADAQTADEWDRSRLRADQGEQIVVLPGHVPAGEAFHIGAARGTGDYVMRMDDDVLYGSHYVHDIMLAAASGPDIVNVADCCGVYPGTDRLFGETQARCGSDGSLNRSSPAIRRDVMRRFGYPGNLHGQASAGLVDALRDAGNLRCAYLDSVASAVDLRDASPETRATENPGVGSLGVSLDAYLASAWEFP